MTISNITPVIAGQGQINTPPRIWRINSTDNLATTIAAGYVNSSQLYPDPLLGPIVDSDIVIINYSGGQGLFTPSVDPTTGIVTLSAIATNPNSVAGDLTVTGGNIDIATAGKTLKIARGSNAASGVGAVLVGGTVTVATTAIATGDIILLSRTASGGTTGNISYTISNGVSFTLTSTSGSDTSTFAWVLIKAG